ncbi:MAG: hypothetical protein ACI3ZB_11975 [Prevotella sp.]
MDSTTTVDEERVLKEYFLAHDDIPEEWEAYAVLFKGFCRKSSVAHKGRNHFYPWVAVAAATIVCVFLLYIGNDDSDRELAVTEVPCDTLKTLITLQTNSVEERTEMLTATAGTKKKRTAKKHADVIPQQEADSPEASEPYDSDELIMQEYIAANFMTLDERMQMEELKRTMSMCQESGGGLSECLNGIGRMVNIEEYDF